MPRSVQDPARPDLPLQPLTQGARQRGLPPARGGGPRAKECGLSLCRERLLGGTAPGYGGIPRLPGHQSGHGGGRQEDGEGDEVEASLDVGHAHVTNTATEDHPTKQVSKLLLK